MSTPAKPDFRFRKPDESARLAAASAAKIAYQQLELLVGHEVKSTTDQARAADLPSTPRDPDNSPLSVSRRRGWAYLDGEWLWSDGVIVIEDDQPVMRYYYKDTEGKTHA